MHIHTLDEWRHRHHFHIDTSRGERRARQVIVLTGAMMLMEVVAGYLFGSMALLADGWHMGTHAAALGITVFAYAHARRHADSPRYCFSTGKVGVLGGFGSAVVLAVIALLMGFESLTRFFDPVTIRFNEAIWVACLGLAVNVVCALMLHDGHAPAPHHDHGDESHHGAGHEGHHDHNLKAAHLHVLADAMTSVLAIVALLAGKSFGWVWMDPLMGVVGGLVIGRWAYGLLRETGGILLDSDVSPERVAAIRRVLEGEADNRLADLHVWRLGSHHLAVIASIVTHFPKAPEHYKELLRGFDDIAHVTVEVHHCTGEPCLPVEN